jgi:sugar/nucleoside kinase (ribokinase family)
VKILLIGDTIIDHDVDTEVSGVSLETPTIKTKALFEKYILGGASAVAKHLKNLGSDVTFLTACNKKFVNLFLNEGIDLINIDDEYSSVKTRIWIQKDGQRYKYLQINDEKKISNSKLSAGQSTLQTLIDRNHFDKIVISDYRLGVVSDQILRTALDNKIFKIGACQQSDQSSALMRLKGCDLLVCNEIEAENLNLNKHSICITLGEKGCIFKDKFYASEPLKSVNSIGAGDSFLAAIAYSDDPSFANTYARNYLISINHES